MSLSTALNGAVAGLTLVSKRAETLSTNVANADRPGYARRSILTMSRGSGLPPTQVLVERNVDPRLVQIRRDAEARAAQAAVPQPFHTALDTAFGDPDQAGSLQDRLAAFEGALLGAGTNPGSDVALAQVVFSASDVVTKINDLSDIITTERQAADAQIATGVEQVNADLAEIARLNVDIIRHASGGHPAADLMDYRAVLVDRVSQQIPVRTLPRDNDAIALVSAGGQVLVDGTAAELSFTPTAPMDPSMTFPGRLSGLSINGRALSSHGDQSLIGGGKLSALFALRDETAPAAMAQLDGLAEELITRFSDPAVDPTLVAGAPGLFTDNGGPITTPATPGLSARLSFTPVLDATDPSTFWRLRDGLGATAADPITGAGTISRLTAAAEAQAVPASSALSQIPGSLAQIAASLKSAISHDRVRVDSVADLTRAQADDRIALRDGGGVDIDAEMQRLLQIEQAYAANARMIQAAGEMLDRLTEL